MTGNAHNRDESNIFEEDALILLNFDCKKLIPLEEYNPWQTEKFQEVYVFLWKIFILEQKEE